MKLCKNCKHFDNSKLGMECKRPMGLSPVTGLPKFRKISAETERTLSATGCGAEAKHFEAIIEDYDSVDPIDLDYDKYRKSHNCVRSGCTVCVAFDH